MTQIVRKCAIFLDPDADADDFQC